MTATTAQTARQPVCAAIHDHLALLGPGRLAVYPGEVDGTPPTLSGAIGRVAPYAIVWGATADPDAAANLAATAGGNERLGASVLSGQITFVAGYRDDLLALLDDAVDHLHLWTPTVPGLSCGRLRQQPGTRPAVTRDDNARPARFMAPWLWSVLVTSGSTS